MSEILRCPVPLCRDTTGHQPRELTGGPICEPCRGRAGSALSLLPAAYVALRTTEPAAAEYEFVTGTAEPGLVLPVHYRDLASMIRRRLVEWEDIARGLRGLSPRPLRVREGWAVEHAVRLLEAHSDVIYTHPFYAPEYAANLLELRKRSWAMLRWNPIRDHLRTPCPHCALLALMRFAGSGDGDYVQCLNCAARWDQDEYDRMVRVMLADALSRADPEAAAR